jgi:hypothetical protein
MIQILVAASHCGAGCTLADIVGEFAVFAPALKWWGSDLWASFVIDYILAWTLGVIFHYFTIVPMRGLSLLPGAAKGKLFAIGVRACLRLPLS